MKLKLHHINLATTNVDAMDNFYRDVLGLDRETEGLPTLEKKKGYAGDVAFVSDGAIQMQIVNPRQAIPVILAQVFGHRKGKLLTPWRTPCQAISPIVRMIWRPIKKHLDDNGIPYSPLAERAVAGWHQIFFFMTPMAMSSKSIRSRIDG